MTKTPRPDFKSGLGPEADELLNGLQDRLRSLEAELERGRGFVRDNPVVALLGALALGYAIARLFSKKKIIYVERTNL